MKTIKIVDSKLYNQCVIDADLDHVGGNDYDLELELTERGMQLMFPENWAERSVRINITGEFGEDDYIYLGFKII